MLSSEYYRLLFIDKKTEAQFLGLPEGTSLKELYCSLPSTHVREITQPLSYHSLQAPLGLLQAWVFQVCNFRRSCPSWPPAWSFRTCLWQHLKIVYLTGNQILLANFAIKDALRGKEREILSGRVCVGQGGWLAYPEVPFPGPAQVGAEDSFSTCGRAGWGTVVRGQSRLMMLVCFTCQQVRPFSRGCCSLNVQGAWGWWGVVSD